MAVMLKLIREITCVWILAHLLAVVTGGGNEDLQSRAFVHVHQERSTASELFARVDAFGDTHDLVLKKIKMPSVEVRRLLPGNSRSDKPIIVNVTEDLAETEFFFDEAKGSLLFLNSDNILEGAVTESMGIRSENGQHIAGKMRKANEDFCVERKVDGMRTDFVRNVSQPEKRESISYTVEVSLVVDSKLYEKFSSVSDMVNYLKVYWYLVHRRFKTVSCATINIALKKIQYSESSAVDELFMEVTSSTTSDLDATLNQMTEYFSDSSQAPFDAAQLMTARDLYDTSGGSPSYSVAGIAWMGSICQIYGTSAYNTGVVEDSGYYEGVLSSAHELAHNLGAPHDGSGVATTCPWSDGYLMSYVANSYKDYIFSSCSSTAMCDIYDEASASCLNNIANSGEFSLISYLAGSYYTLDEQCVYHTGKSNAYADTSVPADQHCYNLQCKYVESPYIYTTTVGFSAIEGTDCYPASSEKQCIDGRCQ